MSQVIVTDDNLKEKRERSRQQERHISTETGFKRWQRSDITGRDPFAAAVGILVTPILAIWTFIGVCMLLMVTIIEYIFKALGKLIGGTRSLITGEPDL